ncbi:MAG: acetyl-CoA carboxylase, biotin carboxyl carrier protein [Verrucomicrobia bacterium GWF2_62_7]|nr:MAG: acetyl-CoA carboxylase, biotin carboxyl carrier protein [Verrucomicrobia bacterium GWF2_62_7]
MKRNELTEFELEREGGKIRIKRGPNGVPQSDTAVFPLPVQAAPVVAPAVVAPVAAPAAVAPADTIEIKSPMVGTFYRAPSPEAAPFIEVGAAVNEETVVCIIEAMKVMNEIKAEVKGVITEVLAENAKAVEFGQPLFRVRKTA